MDQPNFFLNVLELHGCTGFHRWIRIQAVLKPFLWSSSSCQILYPIADCPSQRPSKIYLQHVDQVVKLRCPIGFSRNRRFMSQRSDHEFWHFKKTLIEWLYVNVYLPPFIDWNWIGWHWFGFWLGLLCPVIWRVGALASSSLTTNVIISSFIEMTLMIGRSGIIQRVDHRPSTIRHVVMDLTHLCLVYHPSRSCSPVCWLHRYALDSLVSWSPNPSSLPSRSLRRCPRIRWRCSGHHLLPEHRLALLHGTHTHDVKPRHCDLVQAASDALHSHDGKVRVASVVRTIHDAHTDVLSRAAPELHQRSGAPHA